MVQPFEKLLNILETLLGPEGCPWDREQTIKTLRSSVLEEVHELIEAVNLDHDADIVGELGDLMFNVLFFCKLGEKEGRFTLDEVLNHISDKLVRRHPHVFGEGKVDSTSQVIEQWEAIKKMEKEHVHRKSAIDGLPHSLPALALAMKLHKRTRTLEDFTYGTEQGTAEELFGERLFGLVKEAVEEGIDPEQALRHTLARFSSSFRQWEAAHGNSHMSQ